jgi:multidrug efflux pump subunit AcrA (membrane-fusion protein)
MRFIPCQSAYAGCIRLPLVIAAAAGAVLVTLAAGCTQPPAGPPAQGAEAAPSEKPAVKMAHPERKDVRRLIERPGYNIEAYERTPLYAKLPGYVRKWNFDMGDIVHKDDVMAEIYIPELEVQLRQKKAAVGQAAAEIKQAEAAVLRFQAEQRHAESQYRRLSRVGSNGVLDKEVQDEARFGFEAAQAAVAKALADVEVARERLDVAKADRDHVETLLQYTKIPAPYDGVVTGKRTINTWDFVQPGTAGKEEPLFVVEKINPVRVFIQVQEPDNVWVRDGDAALIRVESMPGQPFKGTVTRTSKSLNPQNRTLRTQIDLPNDDGKLLPGMFVNATIIAEHKNVWALPATAVVTQGGHSFCYRVENGKVVRTPVRVGLHGNEKDNELVEVLKKQTKPAKAGQEGRWEDFTGEEVIVVSDPGALTDGQALSTSTGKSQ